MSRYYEIYAPSDGDATVTDSNDDLSSMERLRALAGTSDDVALLSPTTLLAAVCAVWFCYTCTKWMLSERSRGTVVPVNDTQRAFQVYRAKKRRSSERRASKASLDIQQRQHTEFRFHLSCLFLLDTAFAVMLTLWSLDAALKVQF